MKSFICEMFYKQRAAFEQAALPGVKNILFRKMFSYNRIFSMTRSMFRHIVWMSTVPGDGTARFSRSSSTYMAEASS